MLEEKVDAHIFKINRKIRDAQLKNKNNVVVHVGGFLFGTGLIGKKPEHYVIADVLKDYYSMKRYHVEIGSLTDTPVWLKISW